MQQAQATPKTKRPTLTPAGRAALEKCAAITSAESDPWAKRWRDASRAGRKVLLRISGLPEGLADTHNRWATLTDNQRLTIKTRAKDMYQWLGMILADAERADASEQQQAA